jgi:hypothetical protein
MGYILGKSGVDCYYAVPCIAKEIPWNKEREEIPRPSQTLAAQT